MTTVLMGRRPLIAASQGRSAARWLPLLLLAVWVVQAPGHARSESDTGESVAAGWIQPEEVPERADALRSRLDAARPSATAQAELQKIEAGFAALGPELDALLERATAALAHKASLAALEDARGELKDAAAPLREWKEWLAAETSRVAVLLDELKTEQRVWSETRGRPETAAAGDVVVRRVEISLRAIDEAMGRVRTWQKSILAVSDRVADRSTTVGDATEQLQAATVAESAGLFVRDRAALWQRDFAAELRSELSRAPGELLAFNKSTVEYARRDARPLAVQLLLALILMAVFRGFSIRGRERLASASEPSPALRLLERPYASALLLALLLTPALHPLAPQRFAQMLGLLTLFPAARIVLHANRHANLTAFLGLFALGFIDRIGLALAQLPAISSAAFMLALAIALGLAF